MRPNSAGRHESAAVHALHEPTGVPWTPILTGALAEVAIAAAREIALGLAAVPAAPPADRALYWAYASAVFDEPFAREAHGRAIDDLIAELAGGTVRLGLYGGLAGAGWTLAHVLDAGDDLAAIDHVLLRAVACWSGADDLIDGLVGIGVYFVERGVPEGVAAVAARLAKSAIETDAGATWHTPLSILPPSFAATYPEGFRDCGLAHGVPGIAAFLARAGHPLASEAARWVAAQARHGRFPSRDAEPARTAWCYGDPGVAVGLWQTTPALALATARAAAARDIEVDAAGLCHGAAGLAHIYNRCFHATGEAAFAGAARRAYARALALPRPGDATFLDGAAGLGLALFAATTTTEPTWDRRLLCDLPLHPRG